MKSTSSTLKKCKKVKSFLGKLIGEVNATMKTVSQCQYLSKSPSIFFFWDEKAKEKGRMGSHLHF
jgi:hypothetical protein